MFHVDNNSGVSAMPPVGAVQSSAPRWFTEGGGGVAASYPGAAWFNIVQAELLAILSAGGVTPDKADNGQILAALKALFLLKTDATTAFDDKQPKNATLTALSGKSVAEILTYLGLDAALNDKQPKDNTLTNLSGKDVAGLRTYLGLKTAALRDTGTGANQLPDMSAFSSAKANPGYQKLPSGLIIQWGTATTGADGSIFATYPTAFPNQVLASFCTNLGEFPTGPVASSTPSLVSIRLSCIANATGIGAPGVSVSYFVVGY